MTNHAKRRGRSRHVAELPVSFTDPGCVEGDESFAAHRSELMEGAMAWACGERWVQPGVLSCGCALWVAGEAEAKARAEGYDV